MKCMTFGLIWSYAINLLLPEKRRRNSTKKKNKNKFRIKKRRVIRFEYLKKPNGKNFKNKRCSIAWNCSCLDSKSRSVLFMPLYMYVYIPLQWHVQWLQSKLKYTFTECIQFYIANCKRIQCSIKQWAIIFVCFSLPPSHHRFAQHILHWP